MSNRAPLAPMVLLLLVTAACDTAPQPPTFSVARDSAGVTIIESQAPAWTTQNGWSVDTVPILDLGNLPDGSGHEFFRVVSAMRRSDGSIVVGSRGSATVSAFSPDGRLLFAVGRDGEGPGEYRRLSSVHPYRGDSIAVFDYWQSRITILDASGGTGRVLTHPLNGEMAASLHPLDDGGFVLRITALAELMTARGRIRKRQPLLHITADGRLVDTVATALGYESFAFENGDARVPFAKASHVAVRGDEILIGDADKLGYHAHALSGALRQIVRVPGFPLEVSRAERDSARRDLTSRQLPAEYGNLMRLIAETIPEQRPAYSEIKVDSEGYVWLGAYNTGPTGGPEWYVFAPDGAWLGSVRLPARFRVFEIGTDYLLGSRTDELDVESIEVLRLHRVPPLALRKH